VPANDPPQNLLAFVDHVELETCPILIAKCPAGTMIDSPAAVGKEARLYVQVANRGVESVTGTRVIALWTPVAADVPPLPQDFWSTTFPAAGPCGAPDPSTGWLRAATRLAVVERQGEVILGGATYLFRPERRGSQGRPADEPARRAGAEGEP